MSDVGAELAVPGLGDEHVADGAAVQEFHRALDVLGAAALRADLDDAVVAARRFDHQPAFADVVGARFFDIDMLAGFAGEDGGRAVPVVGRGDHDGVDRLVLEHAPHVGDLLRARARESFGGICGLIAMPFIHIADIGE